MLGIVFRKTKGIYVCVYYCRAPSEALVDVHPLLTLDVVVVVLVFVRETDQLTDYAAVLCTPIRVPSVVSPYFLLRSLGFKSETAWQVSPAPSVVREVADTYFAVP